MIEPDWPLHAAAPKRNVARYGFVGARARGKRSARVEQRSRAKASAGHGRRSRSRKPPRAAQARAQTRVSVPHGFVSEPQVLLIFVPRSGVAQTLMSVLC